MTNELQQNGIINIIKLSMIVNNSFEGFDMNNKFLGKYCHFNDKDILHSAGVHYNCNIC